MRRLRVRTRLAELQAQRDRLTGLFNRTGMDAAYRRMGGGPLVVVLADLDGFKPVNDTLGHDTGDLVLCEVASRINAAMPVDGVAVRLGGDEFAVLAPAGPGDPQLSAARIRERVMADPAWAPGLPPIAIRVSVGAVVLNPPAELSDGLLAADAAMYRAKRTGTGLVVGEVVDAPIDRARQAVRLRDEAHARPLAVIDNVKEVS
jgi:diguanylate cyclase (GGDEF)-like protein